MKHLRFSLLAPFLLSACVATAPVQQGIDGACRTPDGRIGGEPGTRAAEIVAAKKKYDKDNAELRQAGYMLAGGDPMAALRHDPASRICSKYALTP
jgi:hypothetical protein